MSMKTQCFSIRYVDESPISFTTVNAKEVNMRLGLSVATAIAVLSHDSHVAAFSQSKNTHSIRFTHADVKSYKHLSMTAETQAETDAETEVVPTALDFDSVNKLPYRLLQKECKDRGLAANGSTATLRNRILEEIGSIATPEAEDCVVGDDVEECPDFVEFINEADPDFDFNIIVAEIKEKTEAGHWKAATRKLKKLSKRYVTPDRGVPQEIYVAVLDACVADRLHGARASEPARKILEQMAEAGCTIPAILGNQCVLNCLGNGPNGTHEGCGGIDTALAMLAALESSPSGSDMVTVDTYGAVVSALSNDGAVEEACLLLRAMVVEHSFTPPLSVFSDAAHATAKVENMGETVLQVLSLAKASGYILDNIASAEAGRQLLASGIIAAEKLDNLPLGLRLLTAAAKAEGCAPDRGDALVASTSSAAQRACTLIHRKAIDTAILDNNWKLAVKIEQLMVERSLTPSTAVLRKVVGICTKNEKSKSATRLLLDWVSRTEEGKAEKPPISVFNNVVNACEICGEEELTLAVLESMKKVHQSEGNIVTTNIALKRLAKQGNLLAVEGLIIGMLQSDMEPSVVSYTTAIGACVKAENSAMAVEWMKRMRSRNVMPNYHTYNTVLAACLDKKLESTIRGSAVAAEMMDDVAKELTDGFKGNSEYTSVMPDKYTQVLARSLMKQLRENWRADEINIQVAKSTIRVPLLKLVDFDNSDAAAKVRLRKSIKLSMARGDDDGDDLSDDLSDSLEKIVAMAKAHRTMEV